MFKKLLFAVVTFFTALTVSAQNNPQFTLVNHFDQDLSVYVGRNSGTLPDFQERFILAKNESATSSVLVGSPEAYINAKDPANEARFGFFGVDAKNKTTVIYGYMSEGLAYSWQGEVLTFCTPDAYKQNHNSCI